MNISKHFGGKLIDMEPELEPGFDLNYPVPLSKELPGFSGSGSEPGSITRLDQGALRSTRLCVFLPS